MEGGGSSGPSVPQPSVSPGAAPSVSPGVVVAIAVALVAIAGLALALVMPRTTEIDGAARLRAWFGLDESEGLPFALAHEGAARLASGEEIVRLKATREAADEPESATFIRYPLGMADSALQRLFRTPAFGSGPGGPGGPRGPGGPAGMGSGPPGDAAAQVLDWGELDWGPYRARYAVVRSQVEAPASVGDAPRAASPERWSVDSLRVNLSQRGFACALIVAWPSSPKGRKLGPEQVAPLLAVLEPGAHAQADGPDADARGPDRSTDH